MLATYISLLAKLRRTKSERRSTIYKSDSIVLYLDTVYKNPFILIGDGSTTKPQARTGIVGIALCKRIYTHILSFNSKKAEGEPLELKYCVSVRSLE